MKESFRRLLLGSRPVRQWVVRGYRDPGREVRVSLVGVGDERDVTGNNVLVALRPLTLGLSLPATTSVPRRARLEFTHVAGGGGALGTLDVEFSDSIETGTYRYWLCRTIGQSNHCMPRPRIWMHSLHQIIAMHRSRRPNNFRLRSLDLPRLHVFYCCPRPMAIATISGRTCLNMIPMDLMGPTEGGVFSMSVRSTSSSAVLIAETGALTLSDVPLRLQHAAVQLEAQLHRDSLEPDEAPFATEPAPVSGVPVPAGAIRIREVEVQEVRRVGSHHLFLSRVLHQERRSDDPQMCYVSGLFDSLLQSRGPGG